MGKKSSPPPAPDYTAAAEKTAQSSNEAATRNTWANRPDINTPWGSQAWTAKQDIDPATGLPTTRWVQNTTLTPETQAALDKQQALQNQRSNLAESFMGRVKDEYGRPFDWSKMPGYGQLKPGQEVQGGQGIQTGVPGAGQGIQSQIGNAGDINRKVGGSKDYVSNAEEALYQKQASRLDPQWQQRQQQLETQLANRGITRGSSAFQREMENFNRSRTDAYNQAQMGSIIGGGQEAQRLQGMDVTSGQFGNQAQQQLFQQMLQSGQFGNTAQEQQFRQQLAASGQNFNQNMQGAQYANQLRQQAIAEEAMKRGMSLNEMNALLTGQQVGMPTMPSFMPASGQQGVNYYGATKDQYGANMDAYNANQAQSSATGGGIGSLIGGVGGAFFGGPLGASIGSSIGGSVGKGLF
jgi:hypothetical protein